MTDSFRGRQAARIVAALLVLFAVGTVGFHRLLHEGWVASLYRTVVTSSLVGLASPPRGTGAKLLTIVLVLAGVAVFAYMASVVVEAIARGVFSGALAEKRRRKAIESLSGHYVICGYGRVGRRVAEEFRHSGASFIVLDVNHDALAAAREDDVLVIEGRGTDDDDLDRAGIDRAQGVVVCSDDDAANLYITLSARAGRPELQIVARASDEEAEKKLLLAGADRVVTPYGTAGRVMANLLVKPQVAAFLNVVSTSGGPDLSFEQIEVTSDCAGAGKSIGDLHVRSRTGASIVAVKHGNGTFDTRPTADVVLERGDVLVGVGSPDEIGALEELFAPRRTVAH